MQKGQVSSYDVLIAIIIFLLMFTFLRQIPINNLTEAMNDFSYNEMRIYSQQALDSMLKTNGYPTSWTSGDVEIIGLVERENIIDEEKITELLLLDYNDAKDLLALGKYDFNFSINSIDDSKDFSFGLAVPADKEIIVFERIVYYGGEASATLKVFK
jgi:hypothetical protein